MAIKCHDTWVTAFANMKTVMSSSVTVVDGSVAWFVVFPSAMGVPAVW